MLRLPALLKCAALAETRLRARLAAWDARLERVSDATIMRWLATVGGTLALDAGLGSLLAGRTLAATAYLMGAAFLVPFAFLMWTMLTEGTR